MYIQDLALNKCWYVVKHIKLTISIKKIDIVSYPAQSGEVG